MRFSGAVAAEPHSRSLLLCSHKASARLEMSGRDRGISPLIASNLKKLLKLWRDNYYVSLLLTSIAKPIHFVCTRVALELQRKVRKNGVSVRLSNHQKLRFAKDAGVG